MYIQPEAQLMWFVGHFRFQILLQNLRIQFQFHLLRVSSLTPHLFTLRQQQKHTHKHVFKIYEKMRLNWAGGWNCLIAWVWNHFDWCHGLLYVILPNEHLRAGPLVDLLKGYGLFVHLEKKKVGNMKYWKHVDVSKNSGTPKSSILIGSGFSIILTIHFGGVPPIFGSTPIVFSFIFLTWWFYPGFQSWF